MSGRPFPPVGPLDLGSPPSPVLWLTKTSTPRLDDLRLSLARRYLEVALVFRPSKVKEPLHLTRHPETFLDRIPIPVFPKETSGPPRFPSFPRAYMPRSQTPAVPTHHRRSAC